MLLPELLYEQQHLQRRWNKSQLGAAEAQVTYVMQDGWWVLSYNPQLRTADVLFLGRTVEEAENHISSTIETC